MNIVVSFTQNNTSLKETYGTKEQLSNELKNVNNVTELVKMFTTIFKGIANNQQAFTNNKITEAAAALEQPPAQPPKVPAPPSLPPSPSQFAEEEKKKAEEEKKKAEEEKKKAEEEKKKAEEEKKKAEEEKKNEQYDKVVTFKDLENLFKPTTGINKGTKKKQIIAEIKKEIKAKAEAKKETKKEIKKEIKKETNNENSEEVSETDIRALKENLKDLGMISLDDYYNNLVIKLDSMPEGTTVKTIIENLKNLGFEPKEYKKYFKDRDGIYIILKSKLKELKNKAAPTKKDIEDYINELKEEAKEFGINTRKYYEEIIVKNKKLPEGLENHCKELKMSKLEYCLMYNRLREHDKIVKSVENARKLKININDYCSILDELKKLKSSEEDAINNAEKLKITLSDYCSIYYNKLNKLKSSEEDAINNIVASIASDCKELKYKNSMDYINLLYELCNNSNISLAPKKLSKIEVLKQAIKYGFKTPEDVTTFINKIRNPNVYNFKDFDAMLKACEKYKNGKGEKYTKNDFIGFLENQRSKSGKGYIDPNEIADIKLKPTNVEDETAPAAGNNGSVLDQMINAVREKQKDEGPGENEEGNEQERKEAAAKKNAAEEKNAGEGKDQPVIISDDDDWSESDKFY